MAVAELKMMRWLQTMPSVAVQSVRVPLFEETQRSVRLQPVMVIVWSVMMLLLICTQISQIVLRLQKTALLASALLYAVTHMFHEFYPNK